MTHSEVIQLFKQCWQDTDGTTFVSGKRSDASLASIDADATTFVLLPPKVITKRNKANRDYQIVFFVVKQDSVDNSPETRDEIVNYCQNLYDIFMGILDTNLSQTDSAYYGKAQIADDELATPEYQIFAGTYTGYGVQFTLKTKLSC